MKKPAALAALLLLACGSDPAPPAIEVQDAWARAPLPGQSSSAVYATIRNSGGSDRLLRVSSPVGTASLHSTTNDSGIVRMRAAADLEIPSRSTVELEPGGTHVMISGLNRPLEVGQGVRIELGFARSGNRQVMAVVRPAKTDGAGT